MGAMLLSFLQPTPAAAVPAEFEDSLVTTVSGPMDVAWTPDGRMLIPGKGGLLRVYTGGTLLPTPAIDLSSRLCTNGERGLVGIAVHPNFASNRWIYLYYIHPKFGTCNESEVDGPVGRLSRFTLPDTNLIDPASELVLFDTPPMFKDHHTGGDPKFGKDGLLYVTVGDAGTARFGWPQDPGRLQGKVVRVTDTGGIPAGNPHTGAGTARCNVDGVPPAGSPPGTKCQEVFTQGLRNPFRMAMDPNDPGVRFYVNDVGQHSWEEISEGPLPGGDYGWPVREGPCAKDSTTDCGPPPAGMTNPIHWYQHGPDGAAATAGAFVPSGVWPASYDGAYLWADYVFGTIFRLAPGTACPTCTPPVSAFQGVEFTPTAQVVSMRFGPDGALYYVSREGSQVRRIRFTGVANRSPVAGATATPTYGAVPLTVQFDGTSSTDPDGDPLSYEWDFQGDGVVDSTAPAPTHTYTTEGTFMAALTVRDGKGGSDSTTVRVDPGNTPPVPVIDTPTEGSLFAVGDQFVLRGGATDPQDGPLPNAALSWEVIRVHATHTHPFLGPVSGNDVPLTAPEPEDLDAAKDSHLVIALTATDSRGLSQTVTREVHPRFVDVTFETVPAGLDVSVSGFTLTGPSTVRSWENYDLAVNAPDQTDASGNVWAFESWSDGGSRQHTITTPATPATFTAIFEMVDIRSLTFEPSHDAYVRPDSPTTNFGSATALHVDNSPVKHTLMTFDVTGVGTGVVQQAMLRLFATDGSDVGGIFHPTSSSWDEATVNWNSAPAAGPGVLGSLGRVETGNWYEVDLSSYVTGDGRFSVRVDSTSSNGADFSSQEGNAPPQLVLTVGSGGTDTTPPTDPSGLSATAAGSGRVDLQWVASTDDVGVTGYEVWRDGSFLDTTGVATTYSDLTVAPSTTYEYRVRALDGAGNTSGFSDPAEVTTPIPPPIRTFTPSGDTYVRSDKPTRNYGSETVLNVDGSPVKAILMKFAVTGIGAGNVTGATLRIYCTEGSSAGGVVRGLADPSQPWSESTVTWNTAPAPASTAVASLGRVLAGTWYELDVSPLVAEDGTVSFWVDSTSSNGADYSSKEGSFAPQLVVSTA